MRYLMTALLLVLVTFVTACTTQPMRSDVALAHAQRSCRVKAHTEQTYAFNQNGGAVTGGFNHVNPQSAYEACVRNAMRGFKPATAQNVASAK